MSRKMKDSGIEWIGEIPEDWETKRIKNISSIYGRIGFRGYTVDDLVDEGNGAITLSPTNIVGTTLNLDKCSFISWSKYEESPEIMVFPGDIVFVKTASVGKTAFIENTDEKITINPQFVIFKDMKINNKYLFYLLISTVIQEQLKLDLAGGVINTITQKNIYNYRIPITNLEEQQKIANFLDQKVSEIDHILEKTRESIEEYKKYKQSIITEAVTKGLNPNVEMKDSGIEWIGEIPEYWKMVRIKNTSWLKGRIGWQGLKSSEYIEEGPFLITGTDFIDGKINWDTCVHITEERFEEAPEIHIKEDDLLITKDGTVGKVAIVKNCPQKVSLNSGVMIIRNTNKIKYNSKFLYYVLLSDEFWTWFNSNISGNSTILHLYQEQFYNFRYVLPPIDEQIQIIEFLDEKVKTIDSLISQKETLLKDLELYKKSLIYECVTGKREVV